MARVGGIEIPANKQAWVSLGYVFGIGTTLARRILKEAQVPETTRVRDLSELQRTLSDRAAQSHREPDELKLQLAPLLEEQVRREADENWTAEIERLRQALAESLDDLSERVRKAVRG